MRSENKETNDKNKEKEINIYKKKKERKNECI
jgi:hypothetical protein